MTSKDGLTGALVSETEGRVRDLVLLAATLPDEADHLVPINILLQTGVGVKSVASDDPHSFLKSIIDQAAAWWQRSGVRESDLKDAIKECLLR